MYGRKANGELKQAQLEEARLGFIQFLRRKHFSPQFIASHGDDLFATAALEYSRKLAEGEEIETPAGWLITCAWRRTKSLLEAEGRSPHIISTDRAEAIKDDLGQSPEDVTLDEDRMRKVQEAIGHLSVEERRLLELAYFEGMAVREIARQLHWHSSKAQRCHEAARERLPLPGSRRQTATSPTQSVRSSRDGSRGGAAVVVAAILREAGAIER